MFSSHRVHREHRVATTVLTTIPNTNCTKRTSGQATLSHKDNKILPGTFMCRGNKNISEPSVNSVAKNVVAKTLVAQKLPLRTPASPAVNLPASFVPLSLSGKNLSASSVANRRHAGFSMIEILFAIAILALGLLMIAAVFPVAIKWTQQDANKTIGQIIANNAIGMIETKYSGSYISSVLQAETPTYRVTLQPFPGIVNPYYTSASYPSDELTLNDRTYEFGSYSPYPVTSLSPNPVTSLSPTNTSHYYWTALMRMSPSQPATGTSCDVYILVFYKGDYTYTYTNSGTPTPLTSTYAPGARGSGDGNAIPYVAQGSLSDAAFPIGAIGIDDATGAVFRKIVNASGAIVRSDGGPTGDTVLYCPPADGATASPLIYVYTTTVTF